MWRRRIDPNPWMPSARVSFFKTQNYLWKVLYTNPPLYRPVYYNRNGQRVAVGLVGGSFPSHIIKVLNFLNISLASSERTAAPRALAQRSGTTRATFRQVTTRLLPFSITISLHSCARKETSLTTPKFCSRPHSLNEWDVYGVTQLRHLINDCGDWFIITFLSPHSSGVPGGHARFPVGTMLPIRRRSIRKQILRVRSLIRIFEQLKLMNCCDADGCRTRGPPTSASSTVCRKASAFTTVTDAKSSTEPNATSRREPTSASPANVWYLPHSTC